MPTAVFRDSGSLCASCVQLPLVLLWENWWLRMMMYTLRAVLRDTLEGRGKAAWLFSLEYPQTLRAHLGFSLCHPPGHFAWIQQLANVVLLLCCSIPSKKNRLCSVLPDRNHSLWVEGKCTRYCHINGNFFLLHNELSLFVSYTDLTLSNEHICAGLQSIAGHLIVLSLYGCVLHKLIPSMIIFQE